jgi:hypothetical protein
LYENKRKEIIKKLISDLPIQSGNKVPARDSEYLLPVTKMLSLNNQSINYNNMDASSRVLKIS